MKVEYSDCSDVPIHAIIMIVVPFDLFSLDRSSHASEVHYYERNCKSDNIILLSVFQMRAQVDFVFLIFFQLSDQSSGWRGA